MSERDLIRRKEFCERMIDILEDDPNTVLMMSDEAHYHLNGYVNKQNFRYWATTNPRELHEKPLHSPKVTVWCGVTGTEVVGPYFFRKEEELSQLHQPIMSRCSTIFCS